MLFKSPVPSYVKAKNAGVGELYYDSGDPSCLLMAVDLMVGEAGDRPCKFTVIAVDRGHLLDRVGKVIDMPSDKLLLPYNSGERFVLN